MPRKGSLLKVISYNYDAYRVTRQLLQVGLVVSFRHIRIDEIIIVGEMKRIILKKIRKVFNVYKNN
jgi:hypothetical protein